jgi:CubicO group peptidase (beta-lactamase class C family)
MAKAIIALPARPVWGGLFLCGLLALAQAAFARTLELGGGPFELGMNPRRDLQNIRDKFGLPALAAGVVNASGLSWSEVLGVRAAPHRAEAEKGDPFHLGSCTKAMTSTLLAMLVEEGKLSWNATL